MYYQIQTICSQLNDQAILQTIEDLPLTLPETYRRILEKIDRLSQGKRFSDTGHSIVRKIFDWVAVVRRPLTMGELREAISIDPLQMDWDTKRLANNMMQVLASCGNLITVDEEHQTVHFTHHSVRQYLLSEEALNAFQVDIEAADTMVGATCLTYLSLGVFQKQVASSQGLGASTRNYPSAIIQEVLPRNRLVNAIALKLLRDKSKHNAVVHRRLEETAGLTEAYRRQQAEYQYEFLAYARGFWYAHNKTLKASSARLWEVWRLFLETESEGTAKPWEPFTSGRYVLLNKHYAEWIIVNDHEALLDSMLEGLVALNPRNRYEVHDIIEPHHSDTVPAQLEYLIRRICALSKDHLLRRALESPAYGVYFETVPRILCYIAGTEKYNVALFDLAIERAAKWKYPWPDFGASEFNLSPLDVKIIQNFLPPALFDTRSFLWTPLDVAAAFGHLTLVDRMCTRSDWLNITPASIGSALLRAAAFGQFHIVLYFLDEHYEEFDRCVNMQDAVGRNMLVYAVAWNQVDLVRRLVAVNSIDINYGSGIDSRGWTLADGNDEDKVVIEGILRKAGASESRLETLGHRISSGIHALSTNSRIMLG